jgi:hypothetical protein
MSRPRYRIFIGSNSNEPTKRLYYFEDTDPPFKYKDKYNGQVFLYDGGKKDFVFMQDAHDAIIFCQELNSINP